MISMEPKCKWKTCPHLWLTFPYIHGLAVLVTTWIIISQRSDNDGSDDNIAAMVYLGCALGIQLMTVIMSILLLCVPVALCPSVMFLQVHVVRTRSLFGKLNS